jgi:hypothetical protein
MQCGMSHIVICGLSGSAVFLPLYLINGTILGVRGEVIEYEMCILIALQLLSETFLILRKSERDMIKNVYCFSCKVPVILLRFS